MSPSGPSSDAPSPDAPRGDAAALIAGLAAAFGALPQVAAVALGGSRAGGAADDTSDIDLYIYTRAGVPLSVRQVLVAEHGGVARADWAADYWGAADQFISATTGHEIDLVYFDAAWMEAQLRRVLIDHTPSLGYTTALWHTVRVSRPLADPAGWFAGLQALAAADYPEPLRRAIVAYNRPVLGDMLTSYRAQLAKALDRGDLVSVNHRLAALLASLFDIVFAVNRVPHPGEKRILAHLAARCPSRPEGLAGDVAALLAAGGTAAPATLAHLDRLLGRLDVWLAAEGF